MTLRPCWASRKQKTQQPLSCWVSWDILVESGGNCPLTITSWRAFPRDSCHVRVIFHPFHYQESSLWQNLCRNCCAYA